MKRIKQLSTNLINQIAAGEVIERPVSVVKELVENSIDANSDKIYIEISNNCRNIRVADNGSGIYADDIELAFSKHATSKIENSDDLYNIHTLGFRGEALSSIISVSKVTCTTKTKDSEFGVKVESKDSDVKVTKFGCADGTIMDIQDLFYNIPARLKFLRSPKTEIAYIHELIQSLAIINTNIKFELKNDGKTLIKTNGMGNMKNTVKDLFSLDTFNHLREVSRSDKISNLNITGYITTPDYSRSSKKYNIFINSRIVKCQVFQKAIDTAYKNLMGKGKYPFVALNLEIPASDVDVNVHPSKKEVRYKNTNQIFNFIYTAVNSALSFKDNSSHSEKIVPINTSNFNEPAFISDLNTYITPLKEVVEKPLTTVSDKNTNYSKITSTTQHNIQRTIVSNTLNIENTTDEEKIIGQYKNTYILIEKDEGLEIVDQHIADERYIYEKLKTQHEIASQILFVSDIIEVSPEESQMIAESKDKFLHFGFDIEVLNETEVTFKKVPQLLSKVDTREILSDILKNLHGDIAGLEEHILITSSCKSAIKAGQPLTMFQMQELIKRWRKCQKPYTCPHGRPISKVISHKEIAKFFERNK